MTIFDLTLNFLWGLSLQKVNFFPYDSLNTFMSLHIPYLKYGFLKSILMCVCQSVGKALGMEVALLNSTDSLTILFYFLILNWTWVFSVAQIW